MATAVLNEALADRYVELVTHASIHTASPTTGNMLSTRMAITWSADATDDGVRTGTATFTVPANATASHGALWGGTDGALPMLDSGPLSVPYDGPGTYTLTVRTTQA